MVRYAFYGVITSKNSAEILEELRKKNKNVAGCAVMNYMNIVYVDFEKDPTNKELATIADLLGAKRFEKVEETAMI